MEIRDSAIKRTIRFEKFIPYFYLDTAGKVTIGIGNMVPSAAAAAKLPLKISGQAASAAQKEADWTTIKGKTVGWPAERYREFTTCRIDEDEARRILIKRLEQDARDLKARFPDLDKYPWDAQDALLDMIFNLGPTKFVERNWPKLFAAVTSNKWKAAAAESHRNGIPQDRNDEIERLFEAAGDIDRLEAGRPGDVAEHVERLAASRVADIIRLAEAKGGELFPAGITKIAIKVEIAGGKLELEVSGPDGAASTPG